MATERQLRLAQLLAEGVEGCEAMRQAGWPDTTARWLGLRAREYLAKGGIEVPDVPEPEAEPPVEVEPVVEPEPVIEPEPVVEPVVEPDIVSDPEPEPVLPVTPTVTIHKWTPPDPTPMRRPKRVRADKE